MADMSRLRDTIQRWATRMEPADPVYLATYVEESVTNPGYHVVDMMRPDGSTGERREVRGRCKAWTGVVVRLSVNRKKYGPEELVIIGADEGGYGTAAAPSMLEIHGPDHGFLQPDEIPNLHTLQLYPIRCQPFNLLVVRVLPGMYFADHAYRRLALAVDVDLAASVPGAPGRRYALLSLDSAGGVTVTNSAIKVTLNASDIPLAPAGEDPIAAVWLQQGDATIPREQIEDLRHLTGGAASGGGSGSGLWENVVIVAKSGGDYDTIQAGENGAALGVVMVMAGTYAENVTVDTAALAIVHVAGNARAGNVILSGGDDVGPLLDLDELCTIIGLQLSRTLTGAGGAYIGVDATDNTHRVHVTDMLMVLDDDGNNRNLTGVKLTGESGADASVLSRCVIRVTGTGGGTIRAVDLAGEDVVIENCIITGDIVASVATNLTLRNCTIVGDVTGSGGADVLAIEGNCRITGTVAGWASIGYPVTVGGQVATGGVNPLIAITPSHTDTAQVVKITPTAALTVAGATWDGIHIDGAALDPGDADILIRSIHIDLSGVSTANLPHIDALHIQTPATYHRESNHCLHVDGGGIWMDWDATTSTAVDSFTTINVVVQTLGATGGDVHVLDVALGAAGTIDVYALGTHGGVGVVHQHVGVFAAGQKAWKYVAVGPVWTDATAEFGGAIDLEIFSAVNDVIYISGTAAGIKFDEIQVILDTVAGGGGIKPKFEFSLAAAWTQFYPTDDTAGFKQNGSIHWDSALLATWAQQDVNAEGTPRYWIRITRQRVAMPTAPIEDTIKVLLATIYEWDKSGNIVAATLTIGSGGDIDPTDASGQDLGDATHRWDLYTQEIIFGGATTTNIITVPDNIADAMSIEDAGGLEYLRIVSTNANPHVLLDPAVGGINVGIGTADPLELLDLRANVGVNIGSDNGGTGLTNNTIKVGGVSSPHYLNAEERVQSFYMVNSVANNGINMGGGFPTYNAATYIAFFTAANNITLGGTQRVKIEGAGNLILGANAAGANAAKTLVLTNSATAPAASANLVHLYGVDSSDATATLAIFAEQAVEAGAPTFSNKLKVVINGTEYWLGLDAV